MMLVVLPVDMAQSAETQGGEVLGKKREREIWPEEQREPDERRPGHWSKWMQTFIETFLRPREDKEMKENREREREREREIEISQKKLFKVPVQQSDPTAMLLISLAIPTACLAFSPETHHWHVCLFPGAQVRDYMIGWGGRETAWHLPERNLKVVSPTVIISQSDGKGEELL
jgi:hypothetical protein